MNANAFPIYLYSLMLSLIMCAPRIDAEDTGTGRISGTVRNDATGLLLRDASVEISGLNRTARTDELGQFEFTRLPYGNYEIIIAYMGLDPMRKSVSISASVSEARIEAALVSKVYKLEAFIVSGEREGTAAALTRQRMADNVKTVVALDSVGYLPNENPADLLVTLPGLTGNIDDEGLMRTVNIRGIDPELNSVTYDGAQMATSEGLAARSFRFLNITATSFEELEVIKAPTPDMSASSLGGTVNMKTRSTLNMKDDRLVTYRLGMKITPSFWDYTPRRADKPLGPLFSLGYKQIFSIGSGRRNLGLSLDLFHSNNITNSARVRDDYSTTTDSFKYRDYIQSYNILDVVNSRDQDTATLRVDYKHSADARFYITAMYSQTREWADPGKETVQIAYTGDSGLSNYSSDTSSWYSNITNGDLIVTQGAAGFLDRQSKLQAGGVSRFSNLEIDYDASYSNSSVYVGAKSKKQQAGFTLQARISDVGAVIDRRDSVEFPVFSQRPGTPAGKLFYNADNYANGFYLISNDSTRDGTNYEAKINAKTNLSLFGHPVQITSGIAWRQVGLEDIADRKRWKYNQPAVSQFVDTGIEIDPRFGGNVTSIPLYSLVMAVDDLSNNSGNWTFDTNYQRNENAQRTRDVTENTYAGYLMGRARFDGLGLVAGVRYERTDSNGNAWVREDGLSGAWVRSSMKNDSDNFFPSVHLLYAFRKNLQARLSWSTSIGRPLPIDLIPVYTVNTTTQTITLSNPDLEPQYGNSFDLAIEYYLNPVGMLSAGVFRKYISDFIYSSVVPGDSLPDNMFADDYPGYMINTKFNGEEAVVDGIELSYSQQLAFLPKPFDGLSLSLNYTLLRTDGDYGEEGSKLSTKDVAKFIPSTANAQIRFKYRRFSCSYAVNYTDGYLESYSTDRAQLLYRKSRVSMDVSFSLNIKRSMNFFATIGNLTNEPQVRYRGIESRRQMTTYTGQVLNVGVAGRF